MGGSKKVTVGYWYSMGLHMGICHGPVDALLEIRVADRTLWSGSVTANTTLNIDQLELFGGEAKEGGIKGTLDVMMGSSIQGANSYLTLHQGATQPAYRGILGFVFRGRIAANNPYIKPWAARVKRILADWDGGTVWNSGEAEIGVAVGVVAMNPAHIIYQALTDRRRGKGLSPSRLDIDSFEEASATFYSEGLGFCFNWNKPGPIENFVQQVCDHAGAAVGEDPRTGKIRLKAIRHDYDIEDLPVFSREEGNIIEVETFERAAATGTVNEITVRYADQTLAGETGSVTVQHLASIQAQGMVTATTRDYVGAPTGEIAARLAMRDLQASTAGLARVRLRCTRAAYGILPGDVIVFSEPRYGIALMPLRVGHVDYGTLTRGEITIEAVQDVFGLPATTYVGNQGPLWNAPSAEAQPSPHVHAMEATYRDLVQTLGAYNAPSLDPDAGYLATVAARPPGLGVNYQLETRISPDQYAEATQGDWTPYGELVSAIGPTDTTITVTGVDLDLVQVGTCALIDEGQTDGEHVRVEAIDLETGEVTIARGCIDTVPRHHGVGARVWFYDDYAAADPTEYATSEEVDALFRTVSTTGILAREDSPEDSVTMAQRQFRPYPPGNFKINDEPYPASVEGPEITVSWSHRDRLLQQDQLIDTTEEDIGPEAGTTYNVRYIDLGTFSTLDVHSGITGTSDTFEVPNGVENLRVELESQRDGLTSWQFHRHDFDVEVEPDGPPVDVFTENGTWNKPENLDYIEVILVGAGAGGTSGGILEWNGGLGGFRGGGGGGGRLHCTIPAADLPSSLNVEVGVGGAGGAAVSGNTPVDANPGTAGGASSIMHPTDPTKFLRAGGGVSTGGSVRYRGGGYTVSWPGSGLTVLESGWGGAGSSAGAASPNFDSPKAAGGGGPGGAGSSLASDSGTDVDPPERDGGTGGTELGTPSAGGAAGAAEGARGADGTPGAVLGLPGGGGGGGGGASKASTSPAGDGGDGGYPGGGGGAGGSAILRQTSSPSKTSGKGGNGADGVVIIIPHFL